MSTYASPCVYRVWSYSTQVRLGERLVAMNVKIPELVAAWSKRSNEPISKMEFRQHVRKILERPNVKEVCAV